MRIFQVIFCLFLTGCVSYETHGHYKFDHKNLKKQMKKNEVIEAFGAPLKLLSQDDIYYYMYSKVKKTSFGQVEEIETCIMRLEFENNIVKSCEVFNYKDYDANPERTKEPKMQIHLFNEIVGSIGGIIGMDNAAEKTSNMKSGN